MKRAATIFLTGILVLGLCAGAQASTTLKDCALVINGARVPLNASTGYVKKSGSAMMVPVQTALSSAGVAYTYDAATGILSFTGALGKRVELKKGTKTLRIDGRASALRMKTEVKNGVMTADVRCFAALSYGAKSYKNSKALRTKGYKSGALALAATGVSLALPSDGAANDSVLPEQAKAAAKTARQIVTVKYSAKSAATLTYFLKGKDDKWVKQYAVGAYVGQKGIGKKKEGDKKTPTGTFSLSMPFGIKNDPGAAMGGYLQVTANHYWSGQNGEYYNRLVDTSVNTAYKPTKADEHLIDYKGVYNYALWIDYNPTGAASKGSAIFLHCKGKNAYTGGCVAVSESVMIDLIKSLESGAKIVIY
jgi:L,D-peptidoglycan transpeptidase YkuD (ErfK/YbiS/YcfS/YnhG family)